MKAATVGTLSLSGGGVAASVRCRRGCFRAGAASALALLAFLALALGLSMAARVRDSAAAEIGGPDRDG